MSTCKMRIKLVLARYSNDIREYFFCNCIVKIWNQLPSDTDFTTVNSLNMQFLFLTLLHTAACD